MPRDCLIRDAVLHECLNGSARALEEAPLSQDALQLITTLIKAEAMFIAYEHLIESGDAEVTAASDSKRVGVSYQHSTVAVVANATGTRWVPQRTDFCVEPNEV